MDNRLIRCPGTSDCCDNCEVKMSIDGQLFGACGYVLTADDKLRLMHYAAEASEQIAQAEEARDNA